MYFKVRFAELFITKYKLDALQILPNAVVNITNEPFKNHLLN